MKTKKTNTSLKRKPIGRGKTAGFQRVEDRYRIPTYEVPGYLGETQPPPEDDGVSIAGLKRLIARLRAEDTESSTEKPQIFSVASLLLRASQTDTETCLSLDNETSNLHI